MVSWKPSFQTRLLKDWLTIFMDFSSTVLGPLTHELFWVLGIKAICYSYKTCMTWDVQEDKQNDNGSMDTLNIYLKEKPGPSTSLQIKYSTCHCTVTLARLELVTGCSCSLQFHNFFLFFFFTTLILHNYFH